MNSHRVATQCRIPDSSFKGKGVQATREDGKSLAAVGAEIDSKNFDKPLLRRLMRSGAIEEIKSEGKQ